MLKARRQTRVINIGPLSIGGDNPILIQSMTTTKTSNVLKTINQINSLVKAGCHIVRLAILDTLDATSLKEIISSVNVPIVADIHFDYKLALLSIEAGVSKLRLNPGNIKNTEHIKLIVDKCKEKKIPIRIGVNGGSLDKNEFDDTPLGLFESCKRHIDILESLDFYDIVVSIKSSDITKTIESYQLFSKHYDYPVHLGLTESGTLQHGTVKSSIALGHLLLNGIGDTIRVSLTSDPVDEVKVAIDVLSSLDLIKKPQLISCPTCGRCQYDMFKIANSIDEFLKNKNSDIKVAIMGCGVNGPGEAKDADIGLAGGVNSALLFKKGQIIRKIKESDMISVLKSEITLLTDNLKYKYFNILNEDIISLRNEVFVFEQGFVEEFDTIDNISTFVVLYKDDQAIGTGRIFKTDENYHIGRLCLKKDYRNLGYGSIILMLLENTLPNEVLIELSSQDHAKDFYLKNGYSLTDKSYYEEHCLHYVMIKRR